MALAITQLGSTFTTTAGNKTFVGTPSVGDLIVVVCAGTGVTTISLSDNNTDGHGTYETIITVLKNTSADQMIAFVRSDLIQKAVSTTWTTVQASSTGGGLIVYRVTGATLVGPAVIRQSGSQANVASGTPAIPFGVAALTTNAVLTTVFNGTNPPALTNPATFFNDADIGYATPTTGLQAARSNSGFTGSTVTWGSSSSTAFSSLAFEMSAAQGNLAVSLPPAIRAEQAVNRAAVFCFGEKWARRGRLWVPSADRPYAFA